MGILDKNVSSFVYLTVLPTSMRVTMGLGSDESKRGVTHDRYVCARPSTGRQAASVVKSRGQTDAGGSTTALIKPGYAGAIRLLGVCGLASWVCVVCVGGGGAAPTLSSSYSSCVMGLKFRPRLSVMTCPSTTASLPSPSTNLTLLRRRGGSVRLSS